MQEKKTENNKFAFLVLLILIVVFIVLALIMNKPTTTEFKWTKPYPLWYEQLVNLSLPDCPDKIDRGYLPKRIFCDLPDKPTDFNRIVTAYSLGYISNLNDVPKEYWIQPEFVEGMAKIWSKVELPSLQNPPSKNLYSTVYSLAVYPSEFPVEIDVDQDEKEEYYEFDIITSVRNTGYNTFITGVRPYAVYPEGNVSDSNGFITVNPKNVNKIVKMSYPDISVVSQSLWDKNNKITYNDSFIIEPNARYVQNEHGDVFVFTYYPKDYVKLLTLHVKVRTIENGKVLEGKYIVGTAFGSPSAELEERMIKFESIKYKGAGQFQPYPGFPQIKVFINVKKAS